MHNLVNSSTDEDLLITYSISDGLSWGMITYPICMLAAKRGKEISPMMWVLFFVFIIFLWVLNF